MNSLFHEHPELVRSLGIHQLILRLLNNYLGIDSAAVSKHKHNARKLKSLAKSVSDATSFSILVINPTRLSSILFGLII